MLDFRVNKPQSSLNWRYQEIIVTQDFLDANTDSEGRLVVALDSPYEMGKKVLDVYLDGQRTTEGGAYEETDENTIRFDLGIDSETGDRYKIPVGSEIVIKEWFNSDSVLYGQAGMNDRITKLEVEVQGARDGQPTLLDKLKTLEGSNEEVIAARNYDDVDLVNTTLRQRLNSMQDAIDEIEKNGGGIGNGVTGGKVSTNTTYITDAEGNVIQEIVTGDIEYVKDFKYGQYGNLIEEKLTYQGQVFVKTYVYNAEGFLESEGGETVELVSMLSNKLQKDTGYLLGEGTYEIEYLYNANGKIEKEVVTGDYSMTRDYVYNGAGKIEQEIMVYSGKKTTKTYSYDTVSGKIKKVSSATVLVTI